MEKSVGVCVYVCACVCGCGRGVWMWAWRVGRPCVCLVVDMGVVRGRVTVEACRCMGAWVCWGPGVGFVFSFKIFSFQFLVL